MKIKFTLAAIAGWLALGATTAVPAQTPAAAQATGTAVIVVPGGGHSKLVMEHEMGELFKVIGFHKGPFWDALGFREGDRTASL